MWRKWVEQQGIRETADRLGVSYETVRLWIREGQNPKDATKKALVRMADGEFGFADFFK